MKKIFLLTLIILSVFSFPISCKQKTDDDQLAERMAKSESFKAVMDEGKRMASHARQLPDSIINKYKIFKSRMDSFQKNNKLSSLQKRDSMLQIVKIITRTDTGLITQAKMVMPIYKRFYNEFPELIKLPKEEQLLVFKKAEELYKKNSNFYKKRKVKVTIS